MADPFLTTIAVYGLSGLVSSPLEALKTRSQYAAAFERRALEPAVLRRWFAPSFLSFGGKEG